LNSSGSSENWENSPSKSSSGSSLWKTSKMCRNVKTSSRSRGPGRSHSPLVLALHLSAETQNHPAIGVALEAPGGLCEHHRAPRERHRDSGPELDSIGTVGDKRERQERVSTQLGSEIPSNPNRSAIAAISADSFESPSTAVSIDNSIINPYRPQGSYKLVINGPLVIRRQVGINTAIIQHSRPIHTTTTVQSQCSSTRICEQHNTCQGVAGIGTIDEGGMGWPARIPARSTRSA